MTFKVKDLMIELAQATQACHPTFICHIGCTHITPVTCGICSLNHTTITICHIGCTHVTPITVCQLGCSIAQPSICLNGSVTVTITDPGTLTTDTTPIIRTIPQVSGAAIGNLKDQLRHALVLAEQQEAAQAESLQVQTRADADLLEQKLGEALEAVRVRKAELKK